MKTLLTLLFAIFSVFFLNAQDNISWMDSYANEVVIASDTYKYSYLAVEGSMCKIRIESSETDKKGNIDLEGFEFYLTDLDVNTSNFKTSGKSVKVYLKTKKDQDFIRHYDNGEFDGYTDEIILITDAVDKARGILDAFKTNAPNCQKEDLSWSTPAAAVSWLAENIGEAKSGDETVSQKFISGDKAYLASLEISSGATEKYELNLSDINPAEVELVVSGTTLKVELPVKEGKNYIRVTESDGDISYDDELEVYANDIEMARNILNAFTYIATNIKVERTKPVSYTGALDFVVKNLPEVAVGSDTYKQSLEFENSPSGKVTLSSVETDSKGEQTTNTYAFYLNDLKSVVNLEVSSSTVKLELESKDDKRIIQVTENGELDSYDDDLEIYMSNIESARELIVALEYAQLNSEDGIVKHNAVSDALKWIEANVSKVTIVDESYEQTLSALPARQNKISLQVMKTTSSGTQKLGYELYPEDLNREELKLEISGDELTVPLSTDNKKFIKKFEGDKLDAYVNEVEVFFDDVKQARNFVSAMNYIAENTILGRITWKDEQEVLQFFHDKLVAIDFGDEQIEQQFEKEEVGCKSYYTRKETNSKGETTEYRYEFMPSDIDPNDCEISISGDELMIELNTIEHEKLIKPYEDGEAESFIYSFKVYVDDVLTAKKMLDAFISYSKACK